MATVVTEEVSVIPGGRFGAADESRSSATSWGAIAAGGVGAAAFSIFLHELGVGIGLSFLNPWGSAPSSTTISIAAGISLCLISIMASALGGFIAGRLRTRWVGLHGDETYFRDTAHGFLAWAFALILMAIAIGFGATTLLGGAVHGAASGAASNPALVPDSSYYTDMLFRSDNPTTPPASQGAQTQNEEVGRIVSRALTSSGGLSPADRTYVAQRVAARTGLPQDQAEQRVDQVITQAKQAADETRKATAKLAFWVAGAMLCGALAAAFAAAEGGRERDD
jgi:hypothetical protein